MTDLDMLRDALAQRASQAPDTDVVLANAADGLQRLRSKRKATALAGTAAVATGVVVAGVALLNGPAPGQPDKGVQAATVSSQRMETPPGIPPKLPFSVTVPPGYRMGSWSVDGPGGLADFLNGAGLLQVVLADRLPPLVNRGGDTQTQPTTVRGIPAELRRFEPVKGRPENMILTWQITPGKWASVLAAGEQDLRSVAESMTTTPSDPPSAGRLTSVPAGLSVTNWGRGNAGITTIVLCPRGFAEKVQCANLALHSGTAPDEVNTTAEGQKAPLSTPDAAGVRQTPDGHTLVRQLDQGHWAEAMIGGSVNAAQLRDIVLAASAG